MEKWKIAISKKKIRNFVPETGSKNKRKRKEKLKKEISKYVGSDYKKIHTKVAGKKLFVEVCFYLHSSERTGDSKKDLDNLLKILLDVLSENMINGQNKMSGFGFVRDDSDIVKINCEKKIVKSKERAGLDLKISYR